MSSSKLIAVLHSRTFGTIVVMVLYNIFAQYQPGLSPQISDLINGILGVVAAYFHANPQSVTVPAGSTVTQVSPTRAIVDTTPTPPTIPPTPAV